MRKKSGESTNLRPNFNLTSKKESFGSKFNFLSLAQGYTYITHISSTLIYTTEMIKLMDGRSEKNAETSRQICL